MVAAFSVKMSPWGEGNKKGPAARKPAAVPGDLFALSGYFKTQLPQRDCQEMRAAYGVSFKQGEDGWEPPAGWPEHRQGGGTSSRRSQECVRPGVSNLWVGRNLGLQT